MKDEFLLNGAELQIDFYRGRMEGVLKPNHRMSFYSTGGTNKYILRLWHINTVKLN